MRYFLSVDLNNAAFYDANSNTRDGTELAHVLRSVADRVEGYSFNNPSTRFPLFDTNGNRVGTHGYEESEQ